MEVEDPIAAKFRTIVEALMIKTSSEIVKVFTDVMLETRMEISRSWREIDDLKQEMEQREKPAESHFRNRMTQVTFKVEEDEVEVSQQSSVTPENTDCMYEIQIHEQATAEEMDANQKNTSVHEQATPEITAPETSTSEPKVTQLQGRKKICCSSSTSIVSEHQTSGTKMEMLSTSPIQTPPPSIATTVRKRSRGKRILESKKHMTKKIVIQSSNVPHMLRDRHLLSSQKPCLCSTSDHCTQQRNETKKNSPLKSFGYSCKECGAEFQGRIEFENHKCPKMHKCSRCGQIFSSMKRLALHNRQIPPTLKRPFPFKCYVCDRVFATHCGWNIHKRIHAHGHIPGVAQQDKPGHSHSFTISKELKAKVEVRLERISEAQLEAALCPKSSLLLDDLNNTSSVGTIENVSSVVESTSSTGSSNKSSAGLTVDAPILNKKSGPIFYEELLMDCHASGSGTESSEGVRQSDDGKDNSIFPTSSSKMKPSEKLTQSKSLIACRVDSVECDEGSSSASEDLPKELNSLSHKRKISDCHHDVYDGVFPVEKILRWRNTKGRNEVRIKWMPCSLCGAKWKNTWEPAESFIS